MNSLIEALADSDSDTFEYAEGIIIVAVLWGHNGNVPSRLFNKHRSVEKARKDRVKAMKAAKWPVEGLSSNSSGVTYNDLPFEQCSSAEQLRLSCLIGSAANPELKLMFIRDGSLLDPNSLKEVEKIAINTGTQIWIERVSQGSECSIIIEDGHVKGK